MKKPKVISPPTPRLRRHLNTMGRSLEDTLSHLETLLAVATGEEGQSDVKVETGCAVDRMTRNELTARRLARVTAELESVYA